MVSGEAASTGRAAKTKSAANIQTLLIFFHINTPLCLEGHTTQGLTCLYAGRVQPAANTEVYALPLQIYVLYTLR